MAPGPATYAERTVTAGAPGTHGTRSPRRRTAVRLLLALLAAVVVVGVVLAVRYVGAPGTEPAADPAPVATSSAPTTSSAPATTSAPASTSAPPAFDRTQLSLYDPASSWVVVNKARPLNPLDFAPTDLVDIGNGRQLRAEAARALADLIGAAAAEGLTVTVQSAYRSYDHQMGLFSQQVARFGEAKAEVQVARPGYSEHQTGLAADVGGGGCDIESCFGTTAEGRWAAANGPRFGFVVRYPDGRQDVTGYKYEPWHVRYVRYVGVALATELQRTGVPTLEEFFGLPAAPGYPG